MLYLRINVRVPLSLPHMDTIDIHYDKLLEWLVSRKKVPQKWAEGLRAVRALIATATPHIADIPGASELTQGGDITYPKAIAILSFLEKHAEAEGTGGKNLFGQYNNKLVKEWADIVKAYQANGLFLVEAARSMVQLTDYDVPELKNTILSCRKQIGEMGKKRMDLEKSIKDEQTALATACLSMGVQGPDYRASIKHLQHQLPGLLGGVHVAVRDDVIQQAVQYYSAFTSFIRSMCTPASSSSAASGGDGASTVSGSRTGGAAKKGGGGGGSAVASGASTPVVNATTTPLPTLSALCTSPLPSSAVPATAVNDGATAAATATTADTDVDNGIDSSWDIVVDGGGGAEIEMDVSDWEITIDGSGENSASGAGEGSGGGSVAGGACGVGAVEEALAQMPLQTLTDDAVELQAFLMQRLADAKDQAFNMLEQLPSVPEIVQRTDLTRLSAQLAAVNALVALLKAPKLHQLIAIHNSDRHVDMLAVGFEQREKRLDKLRGRIADQDDKHAELTRTIAKTQPAMQEKIAEVTAIKSLVQSSISSMFEGRAVHIMGAVNTLSL